MLWSILARALFVGAVGEAAALIRPFGDGAPLNAVIGVGLALVAVAVEWRLRQVKITHLLGALIGGAIGLGIAWPVTLLMKHYIPAALSPVVVSAALLVSLVTGVLSGLAPAWRAARMDPVDALRNE